MNKLLKDLRGQYPHAVAGSCSENNCRLVVGSRKTHVIFNGKNLGGGSKMCDCIIFRNDKKIILVEIKSGKNIDVDEVIRQFTYAGIKSRRIARAYGGRFEIFCLLLVRGQVRNHIKRQMLKSARVCICDEALKITQGRCRSRLDSHV
ncbi:MAG: hypothetical protein MPJ78_20260 [Hyphomicrobiaceae bacterium]|nr:hypothetical protein [Hyphomicrobiaceae bacterium]